MMIGVPTRDELEALVEQARSIDKVARRVAGEKTYQVGVEIILPDFPEGTEISAEEHIKDLFERIVPHESKVIYFKEVKE